MTSKLRKLVMAILITGVLVELARMRWTKFFGLGTAGPVSHRLDLQDLTDEDREMARSHRDEFNRIGGILHSPNVDQTGLNAANEAINRVIGDAEAETSRGSAVLRTVRSQISYDMGMSPSQEDFSAVKSRIFQPDYPRDLRDKIVLIFDSMNRSLK